MFVSIATRWCVLFLMLLPLTALAQTGVKEDCDVVGKELSADKAANAAECRDKCLALKGCQAAGYISGWGRCFFKVDVKRTVTVRMTAGDRTDSGFAVHEQQDNSGKDFKKLALKNAGACEEACKNDTVCQGFTFIGGYDTCWLKKSKGKLYPKIFYCLTKD